MLLKREKRIGKTVVSRECNRPPFLLKIIATQKPRAINFRFIHSVKALFYLTLLCFGSRFLNELVSHSDNASVRQVRSVPGSTTYVEIETWLREAKPPPTLPVGRIDEGKRCIKLNTF